MFYNKLLFLIKKVPIINQSFCQTYLNHARGKKVYRTLSTIYDGYNFTLEQLETFSNPEKEARIRIILHDDL